MARTTGTTLATAQAVTTGAALAADGVAVGAGGRPTRTAGATGSVS
jgi:hypothetical protein